jgi:hypothetical protein
MTIRLNLVVAALVVPLVTSAPPAAFGQSAKIEKVDMKAAAPRLANGKPDFSGNWTRPFVPDITRNYMAADGTSSKGETNPLPFTPWGQKQWDNYNQVKNGDYAGSCMPFGWIRSFSPHPMQILQNNEYISFLFEQSTMFQLVNTEGLPHRKDWPPTWFGDSRGRWEGDTLVIDVVNINGYAKLGTMGHPMSEQAHLIMTFTRPDMGHMTFNWTLEDPKTYTRPIKNERVFVLSPEVEVMEYACMENNMDTLLRKAVTPWLEPNDDPSIVPAKWEWTSFDLTKPQKFSGVIKELKWERDTLAIAKIEAGGKTYDVALGPPVRLDARGLDEVDVQPGKTLTFEGVVSKQNPNELRVQTAMRGNNVVDVR